MAKAEADYAAGLTILLKPDIPYEPDGLTAYRPAAVYR